MSKWYTLFTELTVKKGLQEALALVLRFPMGRQLLKLGMMAQHCNPSYLGDGGWEHQGSRPAWTKDS
jgi:hypothetical protein